MGHPHGVHVHRLDEPRVGVIVFAIERTPCLRPETVTVDAFQKDALTVEIEALAQTRFKRAEAKALGRGVERYFAVEEGYVQVIETWRLGRPKLRCVNMCHQAQRTAAACRNSRRKCRADGQAVEGHDLSFNPRCSP